MACEAYREELADVAAGDLAAAGLEAHLAACAACREELDVLRQALGLADAVLGELRSAEPGPALRARIRQAVSEERGADRALRWRLVGGALAASVLAATALLLLGRGSTGVPEGRRESAPDRAALASPPASKEPSADRTAGQPGAGLAEAGRPLAVAGTMRPVGPGRVASRRREPEVLVPAGQLQTLVRFVTLVQRERLAPDAFVAVGQTSGDLRGPQPIDIGPVEIVPLDPAEAKGT
jgi:hypothetical protein